MDIEVGGKVQTEDGKRRFQPVQSAFVTRRDLVGIQEISERRSRVDVGDDDGPIPFPVLFWKVLYAAHP